MVPTLSPILIKTGCYIIPSKIMNYNLIYDKITVKSLKNFIIQLQPLLKKFLISHKAIIKTKEETIKLCYFFSHTSLIH